MANWLDKYEQGGLVLKKKTKDNYGKKPNVNDVKVSAGPGFEGDGYTAQNWKSPAWGGQFQMGGSLPGAVGFTYARVAGSAPANGKYTKKTKASAQNGKEMKFYQEGLDFKPKTISKNGSVIKDDMGQWAHPGEITEINSNDITMQGVNYPVLGISDTGDTQMMYPNQDYKFDGEKVTEYPMAQNGYWLSKYATEPMRQDATRNVIPRKMTDKERLEAVAISDQAQKKALANTKEVIAERQKKKVTKGDLNTTGSWNIEEKARLFPNSVGGAGEIFDDYLNPATFVGVLSDALGESVAARDPKGIATSLALATGVGALGFDPLTSVSKAPRKLLNTADRNFSSVGQDLAYFEKIGRKRGLDPQKIKELQMKHVGITSNQREAYTPILSDLAEKYITPYGYNGMQGESKIKQIINNIKQGGVKFPNTDNSLLRTGVSPERSDAWRLYLGKPQQNNTFRIANTSPVNHPSYTPEQLSKMDIYSINSDFAKLGIGPDAYSPNLISPRRIEENMAMLRNKINVDKGNEIMGGYNKRLNQYGLEYNDVWDLQPSIKPADYLPNSLAESSLFSKTSKEGVTSPRSFKLDASKVLGKPFMSHEVMPYTSTDLKNQMSYVFDEQLKHLRSSNVDMTPKINKLEAYKEELKQYPKYKKGGWLNKYK